MTRVHLALNASDPGTAIVPYCKLCAAEPAKFRPAHADFAITEPFLKLALIEHESSTRGDGVLRALKHLGLEVETTREVGSATRRLADAPVVAGPCGDGRCREASSTEATDDSPEASRATASCC